MKWKNIKNKFLTGIVKNSRQDRLGEKRCTGNGFGVKGVEKR